VWEGVDWIHMAQGRSSGEMSWTRSWTLELHKRRRISWL